MKAWLVWCAEYPDEGSVELDAWTEKGARRKYRRATGERFHGAEEQTDLGVCEATPEILAMRAQETARG